MAVFRVERNTGYTVMSNHHLRNKELSLKAKGLLSQMLSLPEDWDYTLAGLSHINREKIDAIREAVPGTRRKGTLAGRGLRHIRAAAAARAGSSYQRRTAAYIGFTCVGKSNIGKSNVGKTYAGKTYVGKSNAIK